MNQQSDHRIKLGQQCLLLLACVFSLCACNDSASLSAGVQGQESDNLPRMANGKPSLQGMWTNVSVTDLQRKEGVDSLVLSPQVAAELEGRDFYNIRTKEDALPNSPEENATLLDGSDLLSGGGYNAFWVDTGSHHGLVKGEIRSSWIVDPEDGRIPFSDAGKNKRAATRGSSSNDGPEGRTLSDRCLMGFGGTAGPPMLNVLYNNTYQIVQTDDHLMILVEMVHDARIIPIRENAQHNADLPRWAGNSSAYWDGDTLVVETTHWNQQQASRGPVYMSELGKVTERFTRYSEQQIFYEFVVEDPEYYSQTWRGEMSFNVTEGPVHEYACHEGNYAMPGILQGARVQEASGKESVATGEDEG